MLGEKELSMALAISMHTLNATHDNLQDLCERVDGVLCNQKEMMKNVTSDKVKLVLYMSAYDSLLHIVNDVIETQNDLEEQTKKELRRLIK